MPARLLDGVALANQIRAEIASMIARDVHDPGVGFVTITRVTVTADLQHARVYYTALGDEKARLGSARALGRAAAFLRGKLGVRLRLKRAPEIEFVYDESIAGQDRIEQILSELRASEWKTFWILWKAGVRVLLVGGTSGSCDWRRSAADEDAVRPGDLVLPRSYLTRDTMPMGLPGTELEFCLPRQVAIMDDPFCPPLADTLRAHAGRLGSFRFRRVHGPEAGVVLNRWLAGNGFESLATCRMLETLGRQMSMPVITGDCVSPVLARVCGMHLAYYHVVANWGTGLEVEDPTIALNRLYMETLPPVAAALELGFLDAASEPTACWCRELLRARPLEYARAQSPRSEQ